MRTLGMSIVRVLVSLSADRGSLLHAAEKDKIMFCMLMRLFTYFSWGDIMSAEEVHLALRGPEGQDKRHLLRSIPASEEVTSVDGWSFADSEDCRTNTPRAN